PSGGVDRARTDVRESARRGVREAPLFQTRGQRDPVIGKHPCDDGVVLAAGASRPCPESARPWVLATTILGSSLAFIDGSVVNVALPALQREFEATVVDVQWVIE